MTCSKHTNYMKFADKHSRVSWSILLLLLFPCALHNKKNNSRAGGTAAASCHFWGKSNSNKRQRAAAAFERSRYSAQARVVSFTLEHKCTQLCCCFVFLCPLLTRSFAWCCLCVSKRRTADWLHTLATLWRGSELNKLQCGLDKKKIWVTPYNRF